MKKIEFVNYEGKAYPALKSLMKAYDNIDIGAIVIGLYVSSSFYKKLCQETYRLSSGGKIYTWVVPPTLDKEMEEDFRFGYYDKDEKSNLLQVEKTP